MTGNYIPKNLKPNILQNTPANVTIQRTNHMHKAASLIQPQVAGQQRSSMNLINENSALFPHANTMSKFSAI